MARKKTSNGEKCANEYCRRHLATQYCMTHGEKTPLSRAHAHNIMEFMRQVHEAQQGSGKLIAKKIIFHRCVRKQGIVKRQKRVQERAQCCKGSRTLCIELRSAHSVSRIYTRAALRRAQREQAAIGLRRKPRESCLIEIFKIKM